MVVNCFSGLLQTCRDIIYTLRLLCCFVKFSIGLPKEIPVFFSSVITVHKKFKFKPEFLLWNLMGLGKALSGKKFFLYKIGNKNHLVGKVQK